MRICCSFARLIAVAALASAPQAWAHHSPSEVIEGLSQRIADGERNASIFVRRADEYRVLGDAEAALADYAAALYIDSEYLAAHYGTGKTLIQSARWDEAQVAAGNGIAAAVDRDQAAPFYAMCARIHEQAACWEQAAAAWKQALASSRPEVDWFLEEAHALEMLGRDHDARRALKKAMRRNASTVLRRAWVRSLVRCGNLSEAGQHIEAGLARSRWKSSWLLLRAQLRLAQNQPAAARNDAQLALEEIDSRLHPESVNPFLAADRETAKVILHPGQQPSERKLN